MNRRYLQRRGVALGLALGLATLVAGCGAMGSTRLGSSGQRPELAGKWSWHQGLPDPGPENMWHGEFVLEKEGNTYIGTLDDLSERTYDDTIKDVTWSDGQLGFTRDGRFGTQQWKGTLTEEDGVLKVVDGEWTKEGGVSGRWRAEKID